MKSKEMTQLHESLRNEMVAVQLRQKKVLRSTQKTRSELTIRRHGIVVAMQHGDHQGIKETGLEENWAIQNLGKNWDKRR